MKLKLITIFAIIFILNSCKENVENEDLINQKNKANITKSQNELSEPKIIDSKENNSFETIKNIEIKQLPIKETTNFDNFKHKNKLSEELIEKLHVKQLEKDASEYYLDYEIYYFKQFKSYVITSTTENEMKTFLVNYNEKSEIIDKLELAYDEIAESFYRTNSILKGNEVEVIEKNYSEEPPITSLNYYIVNENGKITAK